MSYLQDVSRAAAESAESEHYSKLLAAEKARIESELRCRLDVLHSGQVPMEDQAPVLHEQFVSIRFNNLAYEKIKAIDAALERLSRGEYGICEECEEPISEKRLKAIPWTGYCLQCQESLANGNSSQPFHAQAA